MLGTTNTRWVFFQLTVTTVLTLVGGAALALRGRTSTVDAPGLMVLGLLVAAGLSAAVAAGVRTGPHVPPALALLWALPAVLVVRGMDVSAHESYLRWFCAFWLAVTAALPFTWSMRTEARMEIAERELRRLGAVPDPAVDSLLAEFADRIDSLDVAEAGDVEMMYRAWVSSGLAEHGSPIFVTLWSRDGVPQNELRLLASGTRPSIVEALLPASEPAGAVEFHALAEPDLQRLVTVTLTDGRIVTGAISPRRSVTSVSTMGPLFAAMQGGDQEFLTLARLPEDGVELEAEGVYWSRNDEGWGGETVAYYPDGPYTVALTISIANLPVMCARATLLLVLSPRRLLHDLAAQHGTRGLSPVRACRLAGAVHIVSGARDVDPVRLFHPVQRRFRHAGIPHTHRGLGTHCHRSGGARGGSDRAVVPGGGRLDGVAGQARGCRSPGIPGW